MKLILIIKFFLKSNTASYRKSLIFPLICIFLASFIISMTFSIMTGMHNEILKRIKIFSYPYQINSLDYSTSSFNNISNYGISELVLIANNNYDKIIKLKLIDNISNYESKLSENNYIYKSYKCDYNNSISIGSDLAYELNVDIGDTLSISSILDANIITGKMKNIDLVIKNIFEFDFLNYDSDFAFVSYHSIKHIFKTNNKIDIYFENEDIMNSYISNLQLNNFTTSDYIINNKELINAMNIEKYFYMIVGFLTVIISGVMIYNNTVLSYIEKRSQHAILMVLGLKRRMILFFMILNNVFLASIFMITGIILTYLVVFLNKKYYILNYIFYNMPFKVLPMSTYFNIIIVTILLILSIVILSTLIPYIQYRKTELNKQIRDIA